MGVNSLEKSLFKKNTISLNLPESVFDVHRDVKNSFMAGRLVPIGAPIPVLPGDKFYGLELDGLMRTGAAMVAPVLDDIYLDVFAFWVPDRIVWNRFAQFLGENDSNAWDTSLPDLAVPSFGYASFACWYDIKVAEATYQGELMSAVSTGNYFLAPHYGLPYMTAQMDATDYGTPGSGDQYIFYDVSALEFRGYYAIWNEYFRFTEWQRPVLYSKGDSGASGEYGYTLDDIDIYGDNGNKLVASGNLHSITAGTSIGDPTWAVLMPVNRFLDNFTSIKPEPQFGDAVDLFANFNSAPVGFIGASTQTLGTPAAVGGFTDSVITANKFFQVETASTNFDSTNRALPVFTDLSNLSLEIEKVRQGLLLQNYKEVLGRTDARATSIIKTLFGLKFTDFEDDRPRLLNYARCRVGVNQVVATADSSNSAGASSHLGETGAYSITGVQVPLCNEMFNEPGHIHTLVCVRHKNTYTNGIPEQFLRLERLDRYNPIFDRVGMEGVPAPVINATVPNGSTAALQKNLVLGYQLGNYSYKSSRGIVVGALNPVISDSFNFWTLGTTYEDWTALNGIGPGTFIQTPTELDRAFIANHSVCPQFLGDFLIKGKVARRMSKDADPLVLGMRL